MTSRGTLRWWCICAMWFGNALVGTNAQVITLSEAVSDALQNNYALQMARNNALIARNNATIGNAGMLPQVSVGASYDFTNANVNQRFATGQEVNRANATSNSMGTGVSLGWTFFDGFRMFAVYDQLLAYRDIGELDLRERATNAVADVMTAYYDIVRQQQLIAVSDTAIDIAQQRVNISKAKYELGAAPRLDYTQSLIDLNNSRTARREQQLALEQALIRLKRLMGRDPEQPLAVRDTLVVNPVETYDALRAKVLNNAAVQRADAFTRVGRSDVRAALSGYFPQLRLNLNYNFTHANNTAGLLLYNQSLGFNAGVTASFNLFDGFNQHRRVRNARLSLANRELQLRDTQDETLGALAEAYSRFATRVDVLEMQEANYGMAKENINVAMERYRLGVIGILDLRQLQLSFEQAGTDVVQARFEAKLAEIELLRLSEQLREAR